MAKIGIVGTGTIGRPLIHLLSEHGREIGIDDVWFHKRTPLLEERGKVESLIEKGAKLIVDYNQRKKFEELGHKPYATTDDFLAEVDVIIDCTPKGEEMKHQYYQLVNRLRGDSFKGVIAQGGSKETFGKNYAYDVNDSALVAGEDKFIRVVSCNTHQILVVLNSIVLKHEGIHCLNFADFTIERRASDISQDESIGSVEAAKPSHGEWGSHQSHDAGLVLKTFIPHIQPIIHAQVSKVPSQYMHVAHFNLQMNKNLGIDEIRMRFKENKLVASTNYMTSGKAYSEARDNNLIAGRILNQTVLLENTLQVVDGSRIYGTCFTPQDGNALLSSVAAALWMLDQKTYKEKMKSFDKYLFKTI